MTWYLRNMQIHCLVTFLTSAVIHEARSTTFDLYSTPGFLLDMLNVSTPMTNNLRSQIESRYRFQVDRNPLFWPFALFHSQPARSPGHCLSHHALPNSSRSTCSGSRRRNRRSSTRLGNSCFIRSSTRATAFSSPSLVTLVICK